MAEISDVILKRQSMRHFLQKDVSDEVIYKAIELAKWCPSAGNLQAYRVLIVRDWEVKDKLSDGCAHQKWINEAPVIVVVCADTEKSAGRYGDRGRNLYSICDAAAFASYFQLVLVDMGVSSVWVGAFRDGRIKSVLGIPEHLRPVAVIPVGYADSEPKTRTRRNIDDIIYREGNG